MTSTCHSEADLSAEESLPHYCHNGRESVGLRPPKIRAVREQSETPTEYQYIAEAGRNLTKQKQQPL